MAKRALVVDDSPYIQKELSKILEKHGCEVVGTAGNGLEGVKKYKELKPDFVTLDLVMPQMGGIQTLALLKKIDAEATVIMVSSMSGKDKIVECAKAGAKHYILKPFEETKIAEVLQKVVFAEEG
jgi:two-component system chemotaxis response regulator CheY